MGVEAIVRVIEAEAEAEARRLVEEARRAAEERVARAEAAVEAAVAAAAERLEGELRTELVRAVNAARRRRLEAEARALTDAVETVIERARAELGAVAAAADPPSRDRWRAALRRWLEAALAVTGTPATVRARPADAALLAESPIPGAGAVELVVDPDLPPGCRVAGPEGRVEVEATLPVRLARAEERCAEAVARALGLAPSAVDGGGRGVVGGEELRP